MLIEDNYHMPKDMTFYKTRPVGDAWFWAENSLKVLGPSSKTDVKQRKVESVDVFTRDITKTDGVKSDTLFYVFNFADDSGFSIISGPSVCEPILAVTESGHYTPGESTGVEGFDAFMERVSERLTFYRDSVPEMYIVWTDFMMHGDTVNRDVGVKWGQDDIYGQFCPNLTSGCVATAMAQIMAYHQYPSSFFCSCSMAPVYSAGSLVPLNWLNIRLHIQNHSIVQPCDSSHNSIGALMREIGYQVGMIYYSSPPVSSAPSDYVTSAFNSFGYSTSSLMNYSKTALKSSLKDNGPVLMFGTETIGSGGHCWVVDGYKDYEYGRYKYYVQDGLIVPGSLTWVVSKQSHCVHVNWGWNGDCNGFFNFGLFDIDSAISYDNSHDLTDHSYDDLLMIKVYAPS